MNFRGEQANRLATLLVRKNCPVRRGTAQVLDGALVVGVGEQAFVRVSLFGEVAAYGLSGSPHARDFLDLGSVHVGPRKWLDQAAGIICENLDAIVDHVRNGHIGSPTAVRPHRPPKSPPKSPPKQTPTPNGVIDPFQKGWVAASHPDLPKGYRAHLHMGQFASCIGTQWHICGLDPNRREAWLRWKRKGKGQGRLLAAEVILHSAGIPKPEPDSRVCYLDGNYQNPSLLNVMWIYASNLKKLETVPEFRDKVRLLRAMGFSSPEAQRILGVKQNKLWRYWTEDAGA